MILQKLASAIRRQDWFQVLVEVLIVIVGIFLGLQVTDWAEEREERVREQLYLERINEDLEQDIVAIQRAIDNLLRGREKGSFLSQTIDQPELVKERPSYFIISILSASFTNSPTITSDTYEELKFSGDLPIIKNKSILSSLTNYYGTVERDGRELLNSQKQTERYEEARLGILTPEQFKRLMIVGSPAFNDMEFSQEEALLAYQRMLERSNFAELIAEGTTHGRGVRLYQSWLNSANQLHESISSELALKQ